MQEIVDDELDGLRGIVSSWATCGMVGSSNIQSVVFNLGEKDVIWELSSSCVCALGDLWRQFAILLAQKTLQIMQIKIF